MEKEIDNNKKIAGVIFIDESNDHLLLEIQSVLRDEVPIKEVPIDFLEIISEVVKPDATMLISAHVGCGIAIAEVLSKSNLNNKIVIVEQKPNNMWKDKNEFPLFNHRHLTDFEEIDRIAKVALTLPEPKNIITAGGRHTNNFSRNSSGKGYIPKQGPVGERKSKNKRKKDKR